MRIIGNTARILIVIALVVLTLISCVPDNMNFYIFESIEECEEIAEYAENSTIEKYDTPETDKYLGSLEYEAFYAARYQSRDLSFVIYAYEFTNAETAQKYFKNATGKPDGYQTNFVSSKGSGVFDIAVLDGNKAYYAKSNASCATELEALLGTVFSKKLT